LFQWDDDQKLSQLVSKGRRRRKSTKLLYFSSPISSTEPAKENKLNVER
jgi:hypothetical protein